MLPPHELKNKSFSHSLRGYSTAEVDEHIAFILEKYTELYRKCDMLEKECESAKAELADLRENEEVIRQAMVNAKQTEMKTIRDAEERADLIMRTAKINCDRTIMQFKNEIKTERDMLRRLRKATAEFKAKNLRLYKAHLEFIAQFCPDSPETDLLIRSEEEIAQATVEQVKLDIRDNSKNVFTEETPGQQAVHDKEPQTTEDDQPQSRGNDTDEQLDLLFESSIK
ncbi:MAG: DivIVA domain-containing protein [Ruminococcaceae bacterium]|nr:DivIVA domain-containing protein [Oscillospiraceae bacterium]